MQKPLTNYMKECIFGEGTRERVNMVGEGEDMHRDMSAKEIARLIDWLISNGHTAEQANECIKFIAYGK